jgi:hypothetical protein
MVGSTLRDLLAVVIDPLIALAVVHPNEPTGIAQGPDGNPMGHAGVPILMDEDLGPARDRRFGDGCVQHEPGGDEFKVLGEAFPRHAIGRRG